MGPVESSASETPSIWMIGGRGELGRVDVDVEGLDVGSRNDLPLYPLERCVGWLGCGGMEWNG
jgi:hypothetical protein